MRHNQEKVFKNVKDLTMFHERASGERLNNQARGKITHKMKRQKEMESNVQTKVSLLQRVGPLPPLRLEEKRPGEMQITLEMARMEVHIQWSFCSQCFQQSYYFIITCSLKLKLERK